MSTQDLNDVVAFLRKYNRWRRGEDEGLDLPNPREISAAIDAVCAGVERVERERDEARQQEQIHYDNLDEARSLAQAGYAKAERAEKMLRHAAAKADQWRECAEDFAETFAGSRPALWARDEAYAKFEALKKAGVEAALAKFERLKEAGK